MLNLARERVLLTGGKGFLGSHVVSALESRGCRIGHLYRGCGSRGIGFLDPKGYPARDGEPGGEPHWASAWITAPSGSEPAAAAVWLTSSSQHDLTDQDTVRGLVYDLRPTVIIHLAALCGGIGANRERPGEFHYKNLVMGAHLMEYARLVGAKKFVTVGTICSYPKHAAVPFKEEDLWSGYPEETNAAYGLAKKMLLVQGQAYRQQYGFNAVYLLPVNLYGPRDNFDLASSHVIPALIRKFVTAKEFGETSVEVWGTGSATREFLYAADAAEAVVSASEKYDGAEPVNVGAGFEISIAELVEAVRAAVGYDGEVRWDASKPDGQPRRSLDVSRASTFGFRAKVKFEDGLAETVRWFLRERPDLAEGHPRELPCTPTT